jgi:hypothetical protein
MTRKERRGESIFGIAKTNHFCNSCWQFSFSVRSNHADSSFVHHDQPRAIVECPSKIVRTRIAGVAVPGLIDRQAMTRSLTSGIESSGSSSKRISGLSMPPSAGLMPAADHRSVYHHRGELLKPQVQTEIHEQIF